MCAKIDMMNPQEIIMYFRDLFNLANLLKNGLDYEIARFRKQLVAAGWKSETITKFQYAAACGTLYEQELPHLPPERGDWSEFLRNRSRWRK